ncbi:MAG: DUF1206 domain-containing protein [Aquihabitans sp.]
MSTNTVTDALPSKHEAIVRAGRVAIGTQGVLYMILGLLAVQVAAGDSSAKPSQKGAVEAVARQPFGQVLLIAVALGLASHAAWRLVLAIRGEPGTDDEDGKSLAKRAANLGRAAIYSSLTLAAVTLAFGSGGSKSGGSGGSSSGSKEQKSTALVLSWPAGRWLVIAGGLGIVGAGLWNVRRAVTRSFLDKLDCSTVAEGKERTVEIIGIIGYLARACSYGLIGWFLITAGRQHDSSETEGLDGALRELATTNHGPWLLRLLAVGLMLFGCFRVIDAMLRKPTEIAYA